MPRKIFVDDPDWLKRLYEELLKKQEKDVGKKEDDLGDEGEEEASPDDKKETSLDLRRGF